MTFLLTPVKYYIELFYLSQHHHEEINRRLHYCLRLLYYQVLFCKVVENHGPIFGLITVHKDFF